MPVYLIADMHVTDASRYEEYKRLAPLAIEKYGGRYIARTDPAAALAWSTRRSFSRGTGRLPDW